MQKSRQLPRNVYFVLIMYAILHINGQVGHSSQSSQDC